MEVIECIYCIKNGIKKFTLIKQSKIIQIIF